jgi:5-(carboxyamino)imidazole ribonucleotide mutase
MPSGIPVATVALNGAKNAGILAARIVGAFDETVAQKLREYQEELRDAVMRSAEEL